MAKHETSLRDWFAGQALAAIIAKHGPMGTEMSEDTGRSVYSNADASRVFEQIAAGAYRYADAMLAARDPA